MGKYKIVLLLEIVILLAVVLGVLSCTSLSEGTNKNVIVTEPERRVRVSGDETATLRDKMDEQASEINRKRNIEEFDRNEPAMTPPALRPSMAENAPVDSAVHNTINWLMPGQFRNRLLPLR